MLALSACAAPTLSQPTKSAVVEVFSDACNAYATALTIAASALNNNLLSEADIAKVDQAKTSGDAICKGPQPTDYVAAAVNVLQLTATITQTAGAK